MLPAGAQQVVWDGRGDAGEALPTGVYFSRLTLPGSERSLVVKLVMVK